MRRLLALTLASAATLGALSLGSPASAAPAPEAAPGAPGVAAPAVNHRFVSRIECHFGGGHVVADPHSPTLLSCYGGAFHGYWVHLHRRWWR
ncbi:hypothetical protein HII36_15725 [Nonomuraea sp. NN258]|uniref:hypothetical protein n=1 Tax=Nonomuraea antri TaxID=2730852 RepID=UPI00156A117D|nr:hypothetical protein [Nonomuraea antri]NRQ33285.1 hypothetical protein [Nonomuraea antri]